MDFPSNTGPSPLSKVLARASRWYTDVAVVVLTTLIFFLAFVFLTYVYYALSRKEGWEVYSRDFRPRALHRMNPDQALEFFKVFDHLGQEETYIYQPWVGFSERVFHSARLNVDETKPLPTRRTIQKVPNGSGRPLIVWTFGGSTMFGWGVPDDETIASHLSAMLSRTLPNRAVSVTNHGHSYFFSSQELMLFEMLLRRGDRCDVAVFLDGLNDSFAYSIEDKPAFTERMVVAMEREQKRNPAAKSYLWVSPDFPPVRLARDLGRWLLRPPGSRANRSPWPDVGPDVTTYQFNLKAATALGSMYGAKTLFFWQPVPGDAMYAGAQDLAGRVRRTVNANNFYYIADVFKGVDPRDVYVDFHHYGDTANERIAEEIARQVVATLPRTE